MRSECVPKERSVSFNAKQLRYVVTKVLAGVDLSSPEAIELILGTIAQESQFGTYFKQLGGGPALGICQMEPFTAVDIWANYLIYHPEQRNRLLAISGVYEHLDWYLEINLAYQIAMCRYKYVMRPGGIPKTLDGQAEYWDREYNANPNKGIPEEYVANYKRYVDES